MVFKIRQSSVFMFTNNVNVNKTGPRHTAHQCFTCARSMHTRGGFGQTTSLEKRKCFTFTFHQELNKETAYLAVCIVGQLKPSRQEQIWRQLDRIWVLGILIRFRGYILRTRPDILSSMVCPNVHNILHFVVKPIKLTQKVFLLLPSTCRRGHWQPIRSWRWWGDMSGCPGGTRPGPLGSPGSGRPGEQN